MCFRTIHVTWSVAWQGYEATLKDIENTLETKEAELAEQERLIKASQSSLAEQQRELAAREAALKAKEADLQQVRLSLGLSCS